MSLKITSKGCNLLIGTAIAGLLAAGAVANTAELKAEQTPDWTVASCTLWDNPTHTATLPAYTDTDKCVDNTGNVIPTGSDWSTVEDFGE